MGAEVVKEFVEPGRSAQTIEKRVVFQEMMAWIKAHKDEVDFVVVHHFSRVFRSSVDAHLTKRDLKKWGVRIVSTVFDLGDGPEGDMVESILNAVDEYRVKADGADIAYKMGAKAKNGGTIGRARLGYINARDLSEGRNIGVVQVDPERAPFMISAFELYATGTFSLDSLQAELTMRGLRTRPGRHPAGEVSISKLAALLRDPYYLGYVTYKGELIKGRHEALISQELFDRVQVMLDDRGGRGVRKRRHDHYLKGALWCGECHERGDESRMIMQWANGNGGRYLYFFCVRKQQHLCQSRYADGDAIELAVARFYGAIRFPADLADRLRGRMSGMMDQEKNATRLLNKQLRIEIERLDTQEENLIDLAADGRLAVDKVKRRLADVQRKRDLVTERLGESDERLEVGVRLIEDALRLLADPQTLYRMLSPDQRRRMNLAIIEKLYVHEDEVDGAIFRPPFDELLAARDAVQVYQRDRSDAPVASDDRLSASGLAQVLLGDGSNKGVMVDLMGRLSNPPESLESLADQGWSGGEGCDPRLRPTRERAESGLAMPRSEQTGRLSNPVQRRLSAYEVDDLSRLYVEGASIDDLARRFGVHRTTVIHHLDERGVQRRRVVRKMTDRTVDEAAAQYQLGQSLADVAPAFGVHPRTLGRELRLAGVVVRPRNGWTSD